MYQDNELVIRPIEHQDLYKLWTLIYKDQAPEWKKLDAPYFPHQSMSYEKFMANAESLVDQTSRWVITVDDVVCGMISYYFEDAQKIWLEMGIIIHESQNWGKGIGTRALKLWIDHIFSTLDVVRVGLTTWSGNKRMIRVAEKIGMMMEGRMRKVRFYEGKHYDSIRMGILREEWEVLSSEIQHKPGGVSMLHQEFIHIARGLNKTLDVIPVLYGSLGLEELTGIEFHPQDIDVLVPINFLTEKWDILKSEIESMGYDLIDLHEHEFKKNGVKVGIAFLEDLESFASVDYKHLETVENNGATYHRLSISDYLKVYKRSLLDGYRRTKNNNKDQLKIEILQKLI